MVNQDLYEVLGVLQVLKKCAGNKLSYFAMKNIKMIGKKLNDLEKAVEASPEFQEYQATRIALCEAYSEKDESGNFVTITEGEDSSYKIREDIKEEFDSKFKLLQEEYKEAIKEQQQKIKVFNEELLMQDAELDFHKIKFEDLGEGITGEIVEVIQELIIDFDK